MIVKPESELKMALMFISSRKLGVVLIGVSCASASWGAKTTLNADRRTLASMLVSSSLCRSSKASIQPFAAEFGSFLYRQPA